MSSTPAVPVLQIHSKCANTQQFSPPPSAHPDFFSLYKARNTGKYYPGITHSAIEHRVNHIVLPRNIEGEGKKKAVRQLGTFKTNGKFSSKKKKTALETN